MNEQGQRAYNGGQMIVIRSKSVDNFSNEKRKVVLVKMKIWCRNAMMFDVGRDMLVMRMSGLQRRIVGMRLVVVPILLVSPKIDFVAIGLDAFSSKIKQFFHIKPDLLFEENGARHFTHMRAKSLQDKR